MYSLKSFIISTIKLASKIYTYNFHLFILNKIDLIYSYWIKNFIPNASCSSFIGRGCTLVGGTNIIIGDHTRIRHYSVLTAITEYFDQKFNPQILIGKYVDIGEYANITATNRIVISDGVLVGRRVTISDNNHGCFTEEDLKKRPATRLVTSKGEIYIGANVWIGDKATILSGVRIGEGSIIAANTVVTKDIPAYSLVAGTPGVVIKKIDKKINLNGRN